LVPVEKKSLDYVPVISDSSTFGPSLKHVSKSYTINMPHRQILLTCFNEGPKVEEYEITRTKSKLFFTGTKTEIR